MSATAESGTLEVKAPPLEIYYMKMIEPNVDARLGKLEVGRIVPLPHDKALRWLTAGVCTQATRGEYEQQQELRETRASAAQNAFKAANDAHAMWDVSTYRDVLTASEEGLRMAFEAGIPLVNLHILRDEHGHPLHPHSDIEDILDARDLMHPDLVAPFAAHDRSSVMGGGSPYDQPMPLSPRHREAMQRVIEQEKMAQRPAGSSFVADDRGARARQQNAPGSERATRADRRSRGRTAGRASQAGLDEAEKQGLAKPEPASGAQVGNKAGD
jgi:hypothetical protein